MQSKAKLALVAALGVAMGTPCLAADDAPPPPMSDPAKQFIAMVVQAVQAHPAIGSSAALESEREDESDLASSALLPQVSGGFGGGYNRSNPPTANLPNNRIDGTLQVEQLIYDFGATFNRIDSAKSSIQAAKMQYRASANTYVLKAIQTYYDVMRYRKLFATEQDYLTRLNTLAGNVAEREKAGAGSSIDTLRAQAIQADAATRVADYQAKEIRAEAAYQEIFGQAPGPLSMPGVDLSRLDQASADQEITMAKRNNPTLLAQKATLDALTLEAAAAGDDLLPKVSFGVGGTKYDVTGVGHNDNPNYEFSAGLQLSYKLYSGGADLARKKEAEAKRDQQSFDYNRASGELERDTRLALADIGADRQQLAATTKVMSAERAALSARLEQFGAGRAMFLDILDSERSVNTAEIDFVDGTYDVELSRYDAMALTGELLDLFKVKE